MVSLAAVVFMWLGLPMKAWASKRTHWGWEEGLSAPVDMEILARDGAAADVFRGKRTRERGVAIPKTPILFLGWFL